MHHTQNELENRKTEFFQETRALDLKVQEENWKRRDENCTTKYLRGLSNQKWRTSCESM